MTALVSTRVARVTLFILSVAALAWALGTFIFGTVDLVTQLAAHTIRPTMYWTHGYSQFTDEGDGHSGVKIAGYGGAITTSVTGVSAGTVAVFVAATIVKLLTQLVLGGLAITFLERLRSGRVFDNATWRLVAAASASVLAIGVVSQLLAWWSRVAIVDDAGGGSFSKVFVFDPLTITIGLTLALVAFAFRAGEKLRADTVGLV